MERKRSLMARNIARRARILCFNAVQEEKRAFFYRFLLHCVSSSCVSGRMHWSKRRNYHLWRTLLETGVTKNGSKISNI